MRIIRDLLNFVLYLPLFSNQIKNVKFKSFVMKKLFVILFALSIGLFFISCEKIQDKEDASELNGDQSPMGEVGATDHQALRKLLESVILRQWLPNLRVGYQPIPPRQRLPIHL